MIANTLKKWQRNLPFLLVTTLVLFLVVAFGPTSITWSQADGIVVESPLYVRILGWPLLNVAIQLTQSRFWLMSRLYVILVLVWNAFLWAVVLLELKQVLAGAKHGLDVEV